MSLVFEVDPSSPTESAEAIEAAEKALNAGGLVVFPTETVYGIASRPDDPRATDRLFEAKRRPRGLNIPVLAASATQALDLVVPHEAARRLAAAFWPGPLTMVLPRGAGSRGWQLGEATATIGVRVPGHPLSLALLKRAGSLAATSANVSGLPPLAGRAALQGAFGDAVAIYLVTDVGAEVTGGWSSTVVDLTGPELRVLREGPIDEARLAAVCRGSGIDGHSVD
jgi:L-threonylcarbamoyladenylate synthase